VSYTNSYSNDRSNLNRHETKRLSAITRAESMKTDGNPVDNTQEINKMNPIASSDKNFLVLNDMGNLISRYYHNAYQEFHSKKELTQSEFPRDHLTKDLAKVSFKEISWGDTISVKKRDTIKENASGSKKTDHRKTEKLGLTGFILSFLGIIPLFGIPFALLAIIFGAKSLKKIKKSPEKYKGKGFATASIVIGCAMLVFNIVLIVGTSDWSTDPNPKPQPNGAATGCHW
jgi:hypothetical protein